MMTGKNELRISKEGYVLLPAIAKIIRRRGLKGMTMDSVASTLSMSKRTLYEIFGSKQEMVEQALLYSVEEMHRTYERIYKEAENVMIAMAKIFVVHRDVMNDINANFFRDMDECYPDIHRKYHEDQQKEHEWIEDVYRQGVEEDMFRSDVNFPVTCMLLKVQMESLKRMEDHFPAGLTLLQAFDSIVLGFLRSIASPKGMKILDEYTASFNTIITNRQNNNNTI